MHESRRERRTGASGGCRWNASTSSCKRCAVADLRDSAKEGLSCGNTSPIATATASRISYRVPRNSGGIGPCARLAIPASRSASIAEAPRMASLKRSFSRRSSSHSSSLSALAIRVPSSEPSLRGVLREWQPGTGRHEQGSRRARALGSPGSASRPRPGPRLGCSGRRSPSSRPARCPLRAGK